MINVLVSCSVFWSLIFVFFYLIVQFMARSMMLDFACLLLSLSAVNL